MKFALTLACILATVALVCSSTEPDVFSSSIQYELDGPVQSDLISPVKDLSSQVKNDLSKPVEYVLNVGKAVARNTLLHRRQFIHPPTFNVVHIHEHTWIGLESRVITSVQAYQIGSDQGASVWITAGGVGWNFVTVVIQSERHRGFNVVLEVYGR